MFVGHYGVACGQERKEPDSALGSFRGGALLDFSGRRLFFLESKVRMTADDGDKFT
jgi:hypothetical protein